MATGTAVDAGAPGDVPARGVAARWWVPLPAVLGAVTVAAFALPWWRAGAGPVLLGTGPLRALPADVWSGTEVAGARAVGTAVLAVAAVALAVAAVVRFRTGIVVAACGTAAAAGAAAGTAGAAALWGWGATDAPGAWLALAGVAAVGTALVPVRGRRGRRGRSPWGLVLGAALVGVAGTLALPAGPAPAAGTPVGPFVPVAALGAFPLRSGAAGLAARPDDAWPVLADGAPGVITGSGIVVAEPDGRARVIARTGRGAPAPLGLAGDRIARWSGPDSLAVTGLHADDGLDVVVNDVAVASRVGTDGSIWLRSDLDPPETVRRLDLAQRSGEQALSATYLPVVTIQDPRGEGPVDVRAVLPVPGGALRVADAGGVPQIQRLAGTAAGIAVSPAVAVAAGSACVPGLVPGDVRALTADGSGVWFPAGDRLLHLALDGTLDAVTPAPPGPVSALAAAGDGSLLLTTHDAGGDRLWRLPEPAVDLEPAGC